jgi:hypothetical protein
MNNLGPIEYLDVERAILQGNYHRSTMLPRYTPGAWWECDVCEVTSSGYFREYEIKMSRADFRVDAQKARDIFDGQYRPMGAAPRPQERKHDLLAAGDTRGPVEFYFCTPMGLLTEMDIPVWAGWLEMYRPLKSLNVFSKVAKKAPRLHRKKAAEGLALGMRHASYGRLHGMWHDGYYAFSGQRSGIEVKAHPEDQEESA